MVGSCAEISKADLEWWNCLYDVSLPFLVTGLLYLLSFRYEKTMEILDVMDPQKKYV